MNKQELRAIALIVKKLGWNDMPATVAIPAIQKMVANDIAVGLDCCGVEEHPEDSLLTLGTMSAEKVWMSLFISDYQTLNDQSLHHWALEYRPMIERHMREGMSFEDASQACDIPSKEWEWELLQDEMEAEMQESYEETINSLKYCY